MRCTEPVGYLDFLSLQAGAGAIVTDSGGVQEEASALGIPCYTLRANTERPVTISHGTNVLLGDDPARLLRVRPSGRPPTPCAIPLWDGHAAERAADALRRRVPGDRRRLTWRRSHDAARRGPGLRDRPPGHGGDAAPSST